MTRFAHRLAPLVLALTFAFTPSPSRAQPPEEAPVEESEGNPVPGYLATALLCMLILFIVGKSARR